MWGGEVVVGRLSLCFTAWEGRVCVFVVRGNVRVCERLFLLEERNSCWGGGRDLWRGGGDSLHSVVSAVWS